MLLKKKKFDYKMNIKVWLANWKGCDVLNSNCSTVILWKRCIICSRGKEKKNPQNFMLWLEPLPVEEKEKVKVDCEYRVLLFGICVFFRGPYTCLNEHKLKFFQLYLQNSTEETKFAPFH